MGRRLRGSKNWLDHELPPECLRKEILEFPRVPHLNQPISQSSNAHSVKLLSEPSFKVDSIQGQQIVALGCQCSEQNRLIFGFRIEQDVPRGPGITYPLYPLAQRIFKEGYGLLSNFWKVSKRFLAAVPRTRQLPALPLRLVHYETAGSFCRARRGEQNARIQKEPHFFFLAEKAFMAASSSLIHLRMVFLGISRTGMAVAGSSTSFPSTSLAISIGFSRPSRPRLRRRLGGRVTVPRLLIGMTVDMLQCCEMKVKTRLGPVRQAFAKMLGEERE